MLHVIERMWERPVKKADEADVKNAFQVTPMRQDVNVYLELPEGFEFLHPNMDRSKVCLRALNAINGLKQSGNEFNALLNDRLVSTLGYRKSKKDPCLCFMQRRDGTEMKDWMLVTVHVDDLQYLESNDTLQKDFYGKLNASMPLTGGDVCTEHLGVQIAIRQRQVCFCQETKIKEYFERFQVFDTGRRCLLQIQVKSLEQSRRFGDTSRYLGGIGCLNYLAASTRPDVMVTASVLSSFGSKPMQAACKAATQVLEYLWITRQMAIRLPVEAGKVMDIVLYTDASFKSPLESSDVQSRSRAGYVLTMNGGVVAWDSKVIALVAQSAEEAEVIVVNEGVRCLMWLRSLLVELNVGFNKPVVMTDNLNCICWIKNRQIRMRNTHYSVKLELARDGYEEGMFGLEYIRSSANPADMMTKLLPVKHMQTLLSDVNIM